MAKSAAQCCLLWVFVFCQLFSLAETARPTFTGLPTQIKVGESETGERLLYTFSIIDPEANNFTCDLAITGTPTAANEDEFLLKFNTETSKYQLWTNSVPARTAFDVATTNNYRCTVTCTDSNGEVSTGNNYIDIVLEDNTQTTINNVEGDSNDLTLSALGTVSGQIVKTVSATSANPVRFALTNDPSFSPEFFVINNSTGEIRMNRDLKFLDTVDTTMYLTITATDSVNQIQTYAVQTVHFTNQNTLASAINMYTPLQLSELETRAAGDVLFTLDVADPDSTQSHTYRYTCTPTAGEDTFELDINGNFKIAAGQTMDYESISFLNCSFYIDDGVEESGPFILELTVNNDNEAPVFSDTMYFVTTSEGAKGSISFDPGLTCTDPDSGDSVTYDLQPSNYSDRFWVDETTGVFTFNTDYDIDNGNMPTTVVMTVNCIDSGHIDGVSLTGTAQVTVTIEDVNDNEPVFSSPTYTIAVDQTIAPGSIIGTITPTDADSTTNADITCSNVASSTYSAYYTVGADCNVYLARAIDFSSGTHTSFLAYAVDDGTPQKTGTTAIDIVYQEVATTTTSTTTTTQKYNFFDEDVNVALFVLALLMGLALLGLLLYLCMRMCCGGVCGSSGMCGNMCDCGYNRNRARRMPRRQKRVVTPEYETRPRKIVKEEPPRQIITEKRIPVVHRTLGPVQYGGFRQMGYPVVRSAPALAPRPFQAGALPPGYFP